MKMLQKDFFKKSMLMLSALALVGLVSCKDDEDKGKDTSLEGSYISIEDAQYRPGEFPEATSNVTLDNVDVSSQVMNGAANFVTVTTPYEVQKFFLGINGVDGYLEYVPVQSRATENIYVIPLMIAQDFTGSAKLLLSAELEDGKVTACSKFDLDRIETREGDLEIKLAFSNEKDVDIHLWTPSGVHIYYGSSREGYYYDEEEGERLPFGLDIDSNAGCSIDGINKENIYIPKEYVEDGVYTVGVDLYENCDYSIATTWSVTARYKGQLITPISGRNPASGVFEIGTESSYEENIVEVMKFRISGANSSRAVAETSKKNDKKITDPEFLTNKKFKKAAH